MTLVESAEFVAVEAVVDLFAPDTHHYLENLAVEIFEFAAVGVGRKSVDVAGAFAATTVAVGICQNHSVVEKKSVVC